MLDSYHNYQLVVEIFNCVIFIFTKEHRRCECVSTAMPVSMSVTCLSELQSGDHIKWKRLPGYDHHAIVESVNHYSGKVHIIEYGSDDVRDKAVIKRRWVQGVRGIYKYVYNQCNDAQEVLRRAISRLGERAYNVVTNNCEHFATWCKTGWKQCSQIHSVKLRAVTSSVAGGSGGVATPIGRCLASCASVAYKNGTTIVKELKNLVTCGGPTKVLKGVGNAIVNGGKKIGYSGLRSACCIYITGALTVASEVALFGYNWHKAQRNYEAAIQHAENDEMKKKCKEQRNWNIAEAGFEAVGGIGGAVAGAAIGSFIPFVGMTAVGAVVGNIGGRVIGRACGRFLRSAGTYLKKFGTWLKGLFC